MKVLMLPEITIITVNHNGKRFLNNLFKSIQKLDYPSEKIQTILVDNCSTDGSSELVREDFPWVEILQLDKNYGYAGGNNAGFGISRGDYIALINNDCIVEKEWLIKMLEVAMQADDADIIGAVSPKVLFYHDYVPVRFDGEDKKCDFSLKINNLMVDRPCTSYNGLLKYIKLINGFLPDSVKNYTEGLSLAVSTGAQMALPVLDFENYLEIEFLITAECQKRIKIYIEDPENKDGPGSKGAGLFEGKIEPGNQVIKLRLDRQILAYKKSLINSCGLEINRSFYARDRGSHSWDNGQFDGIEEIFSPSGSSLLINKKMLDETGYFDQAFFTYYEDIDLFWRARLKGWKHYFTPYAVARHHHCGTGTEWSYSFSYHVIRNRLLAIYKCGWFTKFIRCYFSFLLSVFTTTFMHFLSVLKGKKQARPDIRARIRIFFELFYLIPKNLWKRSVIRNSTKKGDAEIIKFMADF